MKKYSPNHLSCLMSVVLTPDHSKQHCGNERWLLPRPEHLVYMPPVYFPVYIYTFVCMYFSVRCIFTVKNWESWTWHVGLFWTTMERAQWMCSAIQKLLHFLRNQTLRPNSTHTLMQEVCLSSLPTVAVILATSSTLKTVLCQTILRRRVWDLFNEKYSE